MSNTLPEPKEVWEPITKGPHAAHAIQRTPVPGGWLYLVYRVSQGRENMASTFVPDPKAAAGS